MKKAITRFNYAYYILQLPFWSCIKCFFKINSIEVKFLKGKKK